MNLVLNSHRFFYILTGNEIIIRAQVLVSGKSFYSADLLLIKRMTQITVFPISCCGK